MKPPKYNIAIRSRILAIIIPTTFSRFVIKSSPQVIFRNENKLIPGNRLPGEFMKVCSQEVRE